MRDSSKLLTAAVLTAALALSAPQVFAHASVVSSTLQPGAALATCPNMVEMEFSEDVNPQSVRVILMAGSSGKTEPCPAAMMNPRVVHAEIPQQADGVYNISWKARSALDGHESEGTIPFSVGLATPRVSFLPPVGAPDPARELPPPWETLLKTIGYICLALMLGGGLFAILAWKPAVRKTRAAAGEGMQEAALPADGSWDTRVTRFLSRSASAGAVGVILSTLGLIALRSLSAGSILQGLSMREAVIFGIRIGLSVAAFAAAWSGARVLTASAWWVVSLCGFLVVITFTLSGHNAAATTPLPAIADFLHASGMSAWLGGLLPFAWMLFNASRLKDDQTVEVVTRAVRRFSRVALSSVILIGLTALYIGFLQVQTLDALFQTRYGQAILIKTALFAVLFMFGAVNELWIIPQMQEARGRDAVIKAFRRLARAVTSETVLAVLLLAAVGALTSMPPAYQTRKAEQAIGYHVSWSADRVDMIFRVAPLTVGYNELAVDLRDLRPGAEAAQPTVLFRLKPPSDGMSMGGETEVAASAEGGGRFGARGSYMSMEGAWQVEVILRRSGFNDVRHIFQVSLTAPGPTTQGN